MPGLTPDRPTPAHRPHRLLKATGSVGAATLLSRLSGLGRDLVIARVFGAGAATDAFFVAFRIPNFLRRLFAEGSFALAFVPLLAEYRARGDRAALRELLDAVSGALIAALLLITAAAMLGARYVIMIFAPGFIDDPAQWRLAGDLLRLTFPYLPLISLTALAAGILNTFGRFFLPALTPVLLNLSLIAAALAAHAWFTVPVTALAAGVAAAGALQLLFLMPSLVRLGLLPRPRWRPGHAGVRRILGLMLPTLFGSSVAQVNLLIDTLLASLLLTGSVSWLYYADRLLEFPIGVFGVALATVTLPALARHHANGDLEHGRRTLAWGVRWVWVIGLPASFGLGLLAKRILFALFTYGAFSARDTALAAWAVIAYAPGLPAFLLIKSLAPAYYARQDTKTPVKIAIAAMLANIVLNLAFLALGLMIFTTPAEGSLVHRLGATPGLHAALALASSASAWLNAGLLWRGLHRRGLTPETRGLALVFARAAAASGVMAAGLLWATPHFTGWFQGTALWRAAALAILVSGGAALYLTAARLFGLKPADLRETA